MTSFVTYMNTVGGKRVGATGSGTFESFDPATGTTVGVDSPMYGS